MQSIINELKDYFINVVYQNFKEKDSKTIDELFQICSGIRKFLEKTNNIYNTKFINASEEEKREFLSTYIQIKEYLELLKLNLFNKKENNKIYYSFYNNEFHLQGTFDKKGYPIISKFSIDELLKCNSVDILNNIAEFFAIYLNKLESEIILSFDNEELLLIKESYERIIFTARTKIALITNKGNNQIVSASKFYLAMKSLESQIEDTKSIDELNQLIEELSIKRKEIILSNINILSDFMYRICNIMYMKAITKKYELETTYKLELI